MVTKWKLVREKGEREGENLLKLSLSSQIVPTLLSRAEGA